MERVPKQEGPTMAFNSAGNSAIAEPSARAYSDLESRLPSSGIISATDFEPLHLRLQGGSLQPQSFSCAMRSGDYSSGFLQNANNVLPLRGIQSPIALVCPRRALSAHLLQRYPQCIALA